MTDLRCKTCGASKMSTINSATANNKIWDGYLRLNSAVTVSTIAFFESGEKMSNAKWSEYIEVKGRVKLHDFEKYIQELPRSRSKGLMVVSLNWKEGSSRLGLEGMKKVAKTYVEDERVGLAKVITGIDLYVCPRSDRIITILERYGCSIGRAIFEENKDSLFGCVVWRRNQIILHSSIYQKSSESSRKNDLIEVWSPIRAPSEPSRKNDPIVWSPIHTPSKSSRKNDHIPIWSPIGWPLESSTKNNYVLDITKKRDRTERDKNGSMTPKIYKNFQISYNDLIKSEDTSNILHPVSTEVETINLDANLKPVRPDVTKQDLLEFEVGTSSASCQTLNKRKLEEEMVQDMDISPQKKVCVRYDNGNMLSNNTLFDVAPPKSSSNACMYSSIPNVKHLNVELTHQRSNMPQFTYLGPTLNSMQPNFMPPPSSSQIRPPFQTPNSGFTYLGPILMREHAHSQVHVKPSQSDVHLGKVLTFSRDCMTNFDQDFTFTSDFLPHQSKASNQQYQK